MSTSWEGKIRERIRFWISLNSQKHHQTLNFNAQAQDPSSPQKQTRTTSEQKKKKKKKNQPTRRTGTALHFPENKYDKKWKKAEEKKKLVASL